jgi:HK97 family phage prohead protease
VDGSGLEISGLFATWDEDTEGEAFLPTAFDSSLPVAMALGVPVLYHHAKDEAPIGFVKSCEVKPQGLFGSVVLPAPEVGTKAFDVYSAIKNKLPLAFSVGGVWERFKRGGKTKLLCRRLLEVSITPVATNAFAKLTKIASVQNVKAIGDSWEPVMGINEYVKQRVAEDNLQRIALDLAVAEINSRASRLRQPAVF